MKTKLLVVATLLGTAVMSANAGVYFGINIGLPRTVVIASPAPVYATPVVVVQPAPVYAAPVVVATAPAAVVETVPACPGVGYVWTPGYYTTAHAWVGGSWDYRPAHFDHGRGYFGHDRGYHR
ncbi:MAG TPA: hypothetical protein VGN23_15245 [Verrucomicrobiae bacterium]|jgi:hypothetical protein